MNTYQNNKVMKITVSSRKCKAICHNSSYSLSPYNKRHTLNFQNKHQGCLLEKMRYCCILDYNNKWPQMDVPSLRITRNLKEISGMVHFVNKVVVFRVAYFNKN